MDKKVNLSKTVKDKESFSKVVNTQFTTFTQPLQVVDTDSIDELFRLYNKFYLEIPIEGDNSHTYLVNESSKLLSASTGNEAIQPLLDEISELRQRLLDSNEQILQLETEIASGNN